MLHWAAALVVGILLGALIAVLCTMGYYQSAAIESVALRSLSALNPDAPPDAPQRIPRVILRTTRTADLTEAERLAWDTTARANPEYEQVHYDDAAARALIAGHFGARTVAAYDALVPGPARADLWRYCAMYARGGVYLDAKSAAGPLRQLIRPSDDLLLSGWRHMLDNPAGALQTSPLGPAYGFYPFGEFQQWWLAAAPGHPVFREAVRNVTEAVEARLRDGAYAARSIGETRRAEPERLRKRGVAPAGLLLSSATDVVNLTGPLMFTDTVLAVLPTCDRGARFVPAHGNGVFTYDASDGHLDRSLVWDRARNGYGPVTVRRAKKPAVEHKAPP